MFDINEKVVCVDAKNTTIWDTKELSEGAIYTIRWIGMFNHWTDGEHLCVRLFETDRDGDDIPFNVRRFRPVRKTDISVFEAMLKPAPVVLEFT